MNFRNITAVLLLSLTTFGVVHAAGSPMHEDFTQLLTIADKTLEAGKAKDVTGFTTNATEAVDVAKDQGNKGLSITLQRVMSKFKSAKKAVKGGDFDAGVKLVEEAIADMKKPPAEVKFGGGS